MFWAKVSMPLYSVRITIWNKIMLTISTQSDHFSKLKQSSLGGAWPVCETPTPCPVFGLVRCRAVHANQKECQPPNGPPSPLALTPSSLPWSLPLHRDHGTGTSSFVACEKEHECLRECSLPC